ncbi:uncharacterized protein MYCFIDRAFT_173153 [Pseudocercospora fijiensis CIRAD86]|uniref:Uncharacterized protein n=1 Tax=Pseudocercospora fijiensis (strain CIRAD86) TaxID=383855 RepID=M2ZYS9_PSEFD|nr:uncharacterized protein MYCFIDRAFT_173153 [Pseudocercospora fijiensis CIRAD86]EME84104.1 hypothetical protein MYCFIDRAFT_173153 [Pseudocercospora fijiensis CIRAD86]
MTDGANGLERLFACVLTDDAAAVRDIVNQLDSNANSVPLQAIATFAASHNDVAVLQLCLQLGASLDNRHTSMAIEYAARGPTLLDLLYKYDWRGMRTSESAFNRLVEWSLRTGPDELTWFLEHGAKIDKDTIRRAVRGAPLKTSCVQVLIERYGVNLLKGTRLLQSAAKRGRCDMIKLLLNAGLDVNELVSRSSHGEGEGELTALYEAVYKQHEDAIQVLLEYGADPYLEVCNGDLNTPLRLAEGHGYSRIIGMLRRHIESHERGGRTWSSRL